MSLIDDTCDGRGNPWRGRGQAGKVAEACEVAPGIDGRVGVDPNTSAVTRGPQIGAQRIGGAA